MEYLKLFENFTDIESICREYKIMNYTINSDGSVDVNGSVNLSRKGLTKIPIKFRKVTGVFDCSYNKLTSLDGCPISLGDYFNCSYNSKLTSLLGCPMKVVGNFYCNDSQLRSLVGSPKEVSGDFNCSNNQLISLEGGPSNVGGDFDCYVNQLTSLKGAPSRVGRNFNCENNQLTSLEGGPSHVGGRFYCRYNQLRTLEGIPMEVGVNFYCDDNPIYQIYQLFGSYEEFKYSLDYNYLRGMNIIRSRLKEALNEIGKELPNKIKGYRYI